MEFHLIANIFPLMQGAEYEQLKADIKANGLLEPICVDNGMILDGRNRYRACQELGIEPEYVQYQGVDTLQYVISKNLHRRHLNETQRGVIAHNMANMRQGERTDLQPSDSSPKVSQIEAADMFDISERTLGRIRSDY